MKNDTRDDGIMRLLASLPAAAPDERRARHVRAKCHAELRRRRARNEITASHVLHAGLALLGTAYLAQLARLAVAIAR